MGIIEVKKNIRSIYERRRIALLALALSYAGRAINTFRRLQPPGPNAKGFFWTNRTGQAAARVFTNATLEKNIVTWFISHGVQYGVYLELANDRKHEALRVIINLFLQDYLRDVRRLYGDN